MTGWLILAVYIAGYVFTYRKAYVVSIEDDSDHGRRSIDSFDRGMSAALALMVSVVWPIVILGYLIFRGLTPITPSEREQAIREREAHIRSLERELGISDKP